MRWRTAAWMAWSALRRCCEWGSRSPAASARDPGPQGSGSARSPPAEENGSFPLYRAEPQFVVDPEQSVSVRPPSLMVVHPAGAPENAARPSGTTELRTAAIAVKTMDLFILIPPLTLRDRCLPSNQDAQIDPRVLRTAGHPRS